VRHFRLAISATAGIDVLVTDTTEWERPKNVNSSMHYWASRDGVVTYELEVV
jgi:hypothetical protein